MNLFNINNNWLAICNEILASDGEISDELYNELLAIEEERDEKLNNICKLVKYLGSNNDIISDEINRLKTLKDANDRLTDRLKSLIIDTLKLHNLQGKSGNYSHKLPLYSIWTTNRDSVEIKEEILVDYNPISGTKSNRFIKYNVIGEFDNEEVLSMNSVVDITENNVVPKIDKKELKEFMKQTNQTGEVVEIEEGSLDEILAQGDNLPGAIAPEDIIDFAKIVQSESLTIR